MRPHGSAEELERRRRLAIARLVDGYSPQEVADFLEVPVHSVYRWLDSYLRGGETGLARQPMPGRPPKLTARQSAAVLRWLGHPSHKGAVLSNDTKQPDSGAALLGSVNTSIEAIRSLTHLVPARFVIQSAIAILASVNS